MIGKTGTQISKYYTHNDGRLDKVRKTFCDLLNVRFVFI